jgi:hypothetical protein
VVAVSLEVIKASTVLTDREQRCERHMWRCNDVYAQQIGRALT